MKLIDFGLSAILQPGKLLRVHCGSPSYAAPEIISRQLYAGPPVDVWSTGVVLFAMVAGYLPFNSRSNNKHELCQKIVRGVYTLPEWVSAALADLLRRMLTVDPSRRISWAGIAEHPWVLAGDPNHGLHGPLGSSSSNNHNNGNSVPPSSDRHGLGHATGDAWEASGGTGSAGAESGSPRGSSSSNHGGGGEGNGSAPGKNGAASGPRRPKWDEEEPPDEVVLAQVASLGFHRGHVKSALLAQEHNHATASYWLLLGHRKQQMAAAAAQAALQRRMLAKAAMGQPAPVVVSSEDSLPAAAIDNAVDITSMVTGSGAPINNVPLAATRGSTGRGIRGGHWGATAREMYRDPVMDVDKATGDDGGGGSSSAISAGLRVPAEARVALERGGAVTARAELLGAARHYGAEANGVPSDEGGSIVLAGSDEWE
eukprot:jgi/Mesvir1/24413/Mv11078-RA.2